MPFDWDQCHLYRAGQLAWPNGYPEDHRHYFAPVDDVHRLLVEIVKGAEHSVVLSMFGYDDDEIDAEIKAHAANPGVYVQINLDLTQASGVHEKAILAGWSPDAIGTSIAIGTSMVGHAIAHKKTLIVDGMYVVGGSTNWSASGESKQGNELVVYRSPILAAQYRSILDIEHDWMLKQMVARKAA